MRKAKKSYSHIKKEERNEISILLKKGYSLADIADVLHRDKSTISREVKRNRRKIRQKGGTRDSSYEAKIAHFKARNRRRDARYQGKKIWQNKKLLNYLEKRIRKGWNPEVVSGRMTLENQPFYASKTAIYDFLYSPYGQYLCQHLPSRRYRRRKRRKKKTKKTLIPNRVGIELRPEVINLKREYGHFEGDTIVSGRKWQSKKAISVIYERALKYLDLKKINSLKPDLNNQAIEKMVEDLEVFQSLTLDNGIENTKYEELKKKLQIETYFCDPYSAWQKPGVENVNKLIRRYISKGSDIADYSDKYIENIAERLNNIPRKSLGYKTPKEVMIENGLLRVEQPKILQFRVIKNIPSVALRG